MAIKTCKDCSADVKEKFLSEAGERIAAAVIISFSFHYTCQPACAGVCDATAARRNL